MLVKKDVKVVSSTIVGDQVITHLINGTIASLKNIVPINLNIDNPKLIKESLQLEYGVLIGIIGDIEGKLILSGNPTVFRSIGQSMFGMSLEGDMLLSFSGELGNMIAGGLSTKLVEKNINMDIIHPTILQGNVTLTGFKKALQITALFEKARMMNICLLLDS